MQQDTALLVLDDIITSVFAHWAAQAQPVQAHSTPVADVLGTVSIVQCAEGLFLALHSWSYGGYDASLGAAT